MPCITLRENTEWIETVDEGGNVLVGANRDKIIKIVKGFEPKSELKNLFGDGKASRRIVEIVKKYV